MDGDDDTLWNSIKFPYRIQSGNSFEAPRQYDFHKPHSIQISQTNLCLTTTLITQEIFFSIGGLVTDSLTHSLRHLLILEHKERPLRSVTLRHLIRVLKKHDLNNILTIFDNFCVSPLTNNNNNLSWLEVEEVMSQLLKGIDWLTNKGRYRAARAAKK